ncbi:MAG: AAA family ATPase [Rhodospirillales bacterium]|nr:AAA family ATPase [Rhodospirillales bacterium]
MRLSKIVSIKNIGRFQNCAASHDVSLKTHNLVFAENGRGKTTLCAVLHSLQSGNPAYIQGRKTLGYPGEPEVEISTKGGPVKSVKFTNGTWTSVMSELAIFDGTYISENIHGSDAIDTEQRRNLYRIIIGSQGVTLARRVEDLDAALREKTGAIDKARAAVHRHTPKDMNADDFAALAKDNRIDAKIAAKQNELEAAKKADQIEQREDLRTVSLPELPGGFSAALSKTIDSIANDAGQRIADHIRAHNMIETGEPWLSEGLTYIAEDNCPFCGQSLDGIALIDAYKVYFGEAYRGLKDEIVTLASKVEELFGERTVATIERTLEQNRQTAAFWQDYCTFEPPQLDPQTDIRAILTGQRASALSLLDRKKAAPLEAIDRNEDFTRAAAALAELAEAIATYNASVAAINQRIDAKKKQTDAADIATVAAELTRLNAQKTRHTEEADTACRTYRDLRSEKGKLEGQKAKAKDQLNKHTESVIDQYGKSINRYLDRFNTGFCISTPTHDYKGRIPRSSYRIIINKTPVALGSSETPLSEPSFKNTLSSGDRSTLALAFFLAQLEHDPDRAQKIVVLDDPFTSQDRFRRKQTAMEIKRCGNACKQMLLLSHDPHFLKLVWDQLPPADRKALQLARVGKKNTTIAQWDIEEAVKAPYRTDVETLQRYYNDGQGKARDVVQKIRPPLEGYCRSLYPSQFTDKDTLGSMIGKIRSAGNAHLLYTIVDDLDDLNTYSRSYHHAEKSSEAIDDAELQGYVKRTLALVGYLS